ncbi:Phosphoinositide phosphatase SAC7 [Ananas comosus]|uniref:Phosphoinositide phosphatase SAC7 n=1 Tax=Ananas comosus TaxID=4615 RepID=A0A199UL62_ANACO|nr:Phosphoinositide phosphatase SAC7 [Ananas comosus]
MLLPRPTYRVQPVFIVPGPKNGSTSSVCGGVHCPREARRLRSLLLLSLPIYTPSSPPYFASPLPPISRHCRYLRRRRQPNGLLPAPRSRAYSVMDENGNATTPKKLHTRLRLWEYPEKYILEPVDGLADSYLSISRADGSMKLIGELPLQGSVHSARVQTIYGIIGVLKLLERECVGSYLGHAIFRVSSLQVLPCNHSLKTSSAEQKKMESEFSTLLDAAHGTSGLSQRLHDLGDELKLLPLWRQAEPRFLWNNYMMEPLIDNKNIHAKVGNKNVDVFLIARRCTRRTGTRMWRRGADSDGYVANFVETEQILQSNGFTASFVQVRGSIPFLWEQIVDLTYKPHFDIISREEAPRIVERHFLDLRKKYGSVIAVDLVNKHGSEGRLSQRYADAIQPILSDDIRYVHFDFHRICGHIHFERLSLLYDQIEDYLTAHRYFLLNENGEKIEEQTGVVRTNCIDCLDRTNVTQSMIGRKVLECQLKKIGVLGSDEAIMWANHGDDISIQYSGTPALKGDFVRYGKRTIQGIVKDGWNALARYYLNNFADGTKQDAIDLLQGHYIVSVSRDFAPPVKAGILETYASFRLALALVLAGLMFAMMSLRQARSDVRHLLLSFVWAGLSVGLAAFVRANGRMFTNRPRLYRSRH